MSTDNLISRQRCFRQRRLLSLGWGLMTVAWALCALGWLVCAGAAAFSLFTFFSDTIPATKPVAAPTSAISPEMIWMMAVTMFLVLVNRALERAGGNGE